MSELVYVTREDCHLCGHGRAVLDELGIERREIADSSAEAASLAAKGIALSFMPVLTDGECVIAYGRLSAGRLRKVLGL